MIAWTHFLKGLRQSASLPKMVLFLYIVNLVLALSLAVPMFHALQDSFKDSEVSERMAEGFDFLWWEEFQNQSQGLASTFSPAKLGKGGLLTILSDLVEGTFMQLPALLLAAGLIFLLLRGLMAAGILHLYSQTRESFVAGEFLQGTAAYAFRFLGILLLGWLLFVGLFGPLSGGLDSVVKKVASQSTAEVLPFYLNLAFSVFLLFLYFFFQMVFDYARISTVVDKKENILGSVWSGLRFVFHHPWSALGLLGLGFIGQAAVTVLYLLVRFYIPQTHVLGVLSAFIWLQMFICTLVWIRCWRYSSQMSLFQFYQ